MKNKICFFGSGQMAESIINGIVNKNIFINQDIFCYDINVSRLSYLKDKYNVNICEMKNLEKNFFNKKLEDFIFVLSVKPINSNEVFEK